MAHRALVLVVAAALAAALACDHRAERTAAERRASTALEPAGGRTDAPSPSGRKGDRHARAASRRSRTVKRVEGTLARADGRLVVIRAPGAAPLTLRIAPSTTVTQGGRPAAIEALREGAAVRASYQTGGGGRPTAISIEADPAAPRPPDPAPAPAPAAEESGARDWGDPHDPPPVGGG